MLNKFTVKDYILYSPNCLNCGKNSNVRFYISILNNNGILLTIGAILLDTGYLFAHLYIQYNEKTLDFSIKIDNNTFITNDQNALINFLEQRSLYLESLCLSCHSRITTKILEIDLDKKVIKPFSLFREISFVNGYDLQSYYDSEKSYLNINGRSIELSLTPKGFLKINSTFYKK